MHLSGNCILRLINAKQNKVQEGRREGKGEGRGALRYLDFPLCIACGFSGFCNLIPAQSKLYYLLGKGGYVFFSVAKEVSFQ